MLSLGRMKLREKDMAPGAVFVSDYKNLKLQLLCQEEVIIAGVPTKKEDTGCRVLFQNGRATVENKEVYELMLKHTLFNAGRGFHVDKTDPTGWWRAAGVVKEREVTTFVADGEPSLPKNLKVTDILKKLKAQEAALDDGEKINALSTVQAS